MKTLLSFVMYIMFNLILTFHIYIVTRMEKVHYNKKPSYTIEYKKGFWIKFIRVRLFA